LNLDFSEFPAIQDTADVHALLRSHVDANTASFLGWRVRRSAGGIVLHLPEKEAI